MINLRPLNQFVEYQHFKMEGIHMLKDLFKKAISCPSMKSAPNVSPLPLERAPSGICLPPIWPSICTMSVYQINETGSSSSQTNGNSSNYLLGRHSSWPAQRAHNIKPAGESRVDYKLPEISPSPFKATRVSTSSCGFREPVS